MSEPFETWLHPRDVGPLSDGLAALVVIASAVSRWGCETAA